MIFDDSDESGQVKRWALTLIDNRDGSIASHYGFFESEQQVLAYSHLLQHGLTAPFTSKWTSVIGVDDLRDYTLKATPIFYVFSSGDWWDLTGMENVIDKPLH